MQLKKVNKKIGEENIFICLLEDLILYKLFSYRPIDLFDVEELLKHRVQKIDVKYLRTTAEKFKELERNDVLENLNIYLKNYKHNFL